MTIEHKVFKELTAAEQENAELRAALIIIVDTQNGEIARAIARRTLKKIGGLKHEQ
jgi:hypothetical protein